MKKLKLNKKTVSSLNDFEMSTMRGGTQYCNSSACPTMAYVTCQTCSNCPTNCCGSTSQTGASGGGSSGCGYGGGGYTGGGSINSSPGFQCCGS